MGKTVYFANEGVIDLDVIRVMGVSVKDTENPIGFFGTGLKFAIAVLLRTDHKVALIRKGERYEFKARKTTIRGEEFHRVFMGEEGLGFTTAMGKNWEVWQAYRELHSNTLDEAGLIADTAMDMDTVIQVTGDAIHREYLNRDEIFCSGKPLFSNAMIEVYPGPSRAVFYRGVRAGHMPDEMAFRYNILKEMQLSEDRNFSSQYDVEFTLARLIPTIEHKGVVSELLEGTEKFDQNVDYAMCGNPSPQFLEVASARYNDQTAPAGAKALVERDMQSRAEFKPATLSDAEQEKFLSAFRYLREGLRCTLSPEDVEVVESLGPDVMAIYHKAKEQIFLAKSTLDWGLETVVAALFEEWLHKEYHYRDESRALQNFLFQRLAALTMEAQGPEPESQLGMWF